MPSAVGVVDRADHLGLLDEVLGDAAADIDDAGLLRGFDDPGDLVGVGELVDVHLDAVPAGDHEPDADRGVGERGDEDGDAFSDAGGEEGGALGGGAGDVPAEGIEERPRRAAERCHFPGELGDLPVGGPELLLEGEDVVDPVDTPAEELGVVDVVMALVVADPEVLAGVVEDVGAGGDDRVDVMVPDEGAQHLAHAGGDHRAGEPEEDGAVGVTEHLSPDPDRFAELPPLEAG
ncbi:hypothetical protein DSECCO2_464670 [anaerobic digester metagenome]